MQISQATHPPTQDFLKENESMRLQLNVQATQIQKLTEYLKAMRRVSQNYVVTHPDSAQVPISSGISNNFSQQQVRGNQSYSAFKPQGIPTSKSTAEERLMISA